MADPLTILFDVLHFSKTITNAIESGTSDDSSSSSDSASIESVFKSYSYNNADTFTINVDLEPVVKDLQDLTAKIKHDSDYNVNALYANLKIVNLIDLTLDARLQTPYNQYQGVPEEIATQKASGKYN